MHFTGLLSLLAIGIAVALPASPFEDEVNLLRRQVPSKTCSHITGGVHVIALGGANTNNPRDYGYLGSLAGSILSAIPGSTNVSLPYDKVLASQSPPKLQPGAIANGMTLLKQYVVDYHHYCPNTKIVIIGYSSGAVIAMNDFCYGGSGQGTPQLNPLIAGNYVIAGVVYGEETYTPNQPWNKGTCTTGSGTAPRANPSLCYPYANYLQSYCDTADPDCCVGTGNSPTVHFSYPKKYDAAATAFVKSRLAAAGGA